MKSKKATYLLLILSFVIWGIVGWRVYQSLNTNTIAIKRNDIRTSRQDSTSLILNYRDPFLGDYNVLIKTEVPVTETKINQTNIPPQKDMLVTPTFQFKGLLKVNTSQMAIIQSNSETFTIKKGAELEGFKLIEIGESKITLIKGGKKYEIPIQ